MNILPHKSWHVRKKDNIARVRRDEALAAEEEKKKQIKIQSAEREARTEVLRKKARQQYGVQFSNESSNRFLPNRHVNFFYEMEKNEVVSNKSNEDYEKEKKIEKEKYEKQIGYLTYLGQDTNEITGQVSWYNKPREENLKEQAEVSKKQKIFEDPLEDIRKYLGCDGIRKINESAKSKREEINDTVKKQKGSDSKHSLKHKKSQKNKKSKHKKKKKYKKKYSSESEEESEVKKGIKQEIVDLERLRSERIRREREERKRANEVFDRLNGVSVIKKQDIEPETSQRYNSQFNPHLAKQNFFSK